jgi:hypothetical protein
MAKQLMRFELLEGTYVAIPPEAEAKRPRRKDFDGKHPDHPNMPDLRPATAENTIIFTDLVANWDREHQRFHRWNDPNSNIIETYEDLERFNDPNPNVKGKFRRIIEKQDGLLHQLPGESLEQFAARVQGLATAGGQQPQQEVREPLPSSLVDTNDTYESMTEKELRKMAEEEEIPLGNAKQKKDIIAAIRAHEGQMAAAR